jgi:hypothetical protein
MVLAYRNRLIRGADDFYHHPIIITSPTTGKKPFRFFARLAEQARGQDMLTS